MNTDDILDEINYLKKKTILLEKMLSKNVNSEEAIESNIQETTTHNKPNISIQKRTIC
jgi:hypothetical protein